MNISDLHRRVIGSAPKQQFLLDEFPNAAAAYSLRLLRSGYTGNCIEVRRSSDNALQNIGFVNGVLDTASLLSFVGAGNGFVRTWYDQSGNARNAFSVVDNQQLRIISSGVMDMIDSRPCLTTTSRNTQRHLEVPLSQLQNLPVSIIVSGLIVQTAVNGFSNLSKIIAGPAGVNNNSRYEFNANINNFTFLRRNSSSFIISGFNTNQFVASGFFRSELDAKFNGSDVLPSHVYSGTILGNTGNFLIFTKADTTFNPNAKITEVVFYLSDEYNNRNGIESNINDYYNIF
jgi:hypothetical protein